MSSSSTSSSMHSTTRTSTCSASESAGGRVWGVTVSGPRVGPMTRASRTTIHPVGVRQVVTSTLVPGSYARADGTLIPKGPNRKVPASRSRRLAKMLGESKRGTHSQSTDPSGATRAPVWQSDRKAYSAMGGNGDGAAALAGPLLGAAALGRVSRADGVRDRRVAIVSSDVGGVHDATTPARDDGSGFADRSARGRGEAEASTRFSR